MRETKYRVYLDVCCLNRPFDDQTQPRIYLKSQAVLTIINKCQEGTAKLINSSAIISELNQTPNQERRQNVKKLLELATIKVIHTTEVQNRTAELEQLGLTSYDAAHIASAEKARADVFLTTDERLARKAQKNLELISVKVKNPVIWLAEITQLEETNDENSI